MKKQDTNNQLSNNQIPRTKKTTNNQQQKYEQPKVTYQLLQNVAHVDDKQQKQQQQQQYDYEQQQQQEQAKQQLNGDSDSEQQQYDLFADMEPTEPVIYGGEGYSYIYGNSFDGKDPKQILRNLKAHRKQQDQTVNLKIVSLKIKQQHNETVCKIFRKISSRDWISLELVNCDIPECYLKQINSYGMKYILIKYTPITNFNMQVPNMEQLSFNDTRITQSDGSFLKNYSRLKHLFTSNKQEAQFLTSKIAEFGLDIQMHYHQTLWK